jgi:hypothetical protein
MSLSEEERRTIVQLEMERARRTLKEVETLREAELWNGVCNRLYYAVFHAVSALLIHDGFQVYTHHGSHAMFGQHYIKKGVLSAEYGRLYNQLQTMREESDYNCAFEAEPDELKDKIEPACQMIEAIGEMVGG